MASSTPCVMDAEELGFNTRIRVVCLTKWVVILFSVTMEIRISRLLQSERSTLDIPMMPLSSTRGPGTVGVRGITWIHQASSSQRSPVARAAVHNADDDPTMNLATPSSVTGRQHPATTTPLTPSPLNTTTTGCRSQTTPTHDQAIANAHNGVPPSHRQAILFWFVLAPADTG